MRRLLFFAAIWLTGFFACSVGSFDIVWGGCGGSLGGWVTEGGVPMPGVVVELFDFPSDERGWLIETDTTDANGYYGYSNCCWHYSNDEFSPRVQVAFRVADVEVAHADVSMGCGESVRVDYDTVTGVSRP
jgi:hypothetical protein